MKEIHLTVKLSAFTIDHKCTAVATVVSAAPVLDASEALGPSTEGTGSDMAEALQEAVNQIIQRLKGVR